MEKEKLFKELRKLSKEEIILFLSQDYRFSTTYTVEHIKSFKLNKAKIKYKAKMAEHNAKEDYFTKRIKERDQLAKKFNETKDISILRKVNEIEKEYQAHLKEWETINNDLDKVYKI